MKLREVTIKNFRCLKNITVPIATDTTVLVGENNSGKTSFLEALGIALSPYRENPFTEYDYHMAEAHDSPESCKEGIVIELWFREDSKEKWPRPLLQALEPIIQTDPLADINSIGLRLSSQYNESSESMVTKYEFLQVDGEPLVRSDADPLDLERFLNYIRYFYMSALRDSANEFSPQSKFWGRILRNLKIEGEQQNALSKNLAELNEELLKAHPMLEDVKGILDKSQEIMGIEPGLKTSIQALPHKPWDLMSKAQVAIKSRGGTIDLPLARHGQGTQSLAILFLFQAYIDVLLKPTFERETEAILALEEPESHLHPQATRMLAASLDKIKSQKIISSHSPYFIQEVPLTNIQMFCREGASSKVLCVKRSFSVEVPYSPKLPEFCTSNDKYSYHQHSLPVNGEEEHKHSPIVNEEEEYKHSLTLNEEEEHKCFLTVRGKVDEKEYRKLSTCYQGNINAQTVLKQLKNESQIYLDKRELAHLDTFIKRFRGEVLFARAWLLCEGQSDYLLFHYFAKLLGTRLDQAGITAIDFQNNGSPGAFVGLAQTFEIPWLMVCDNDGAGKNFVEQVKNRGLTDDEINAYIKPLPGEGVDLELFLVRNGFKDEYMEILPENEKGELTKIKDEDGFEDELAACIRKDKVRYALALIENLDAKKADKSRVPEFIVSAINKLIARVREGINGDKRAAQVMGRVVTNSDGGVKVG